MVQVLPQEPGLGELLGMGVSSGLQQIMQQKIQKQQQMQQAAKAVPLYQQLFPEMSQEQVMSLASQPTQIQQEMIDGLMKQRQEMGKQQVSLYEQQLKTQQALEKEEKTKEGLKQSFQRLEELLPYSGWQIPFTKSHMYGGLARERVQKREEFTTLGFWATDAVYTHFNKGVLSREKLKVLKEDLSPRAGLTVRENTARINALRKISNLPPDIDSSKLDKIIDKEVSNIKGKTKQFTVNGSEYEIPIELINEFKNEMGIK